MLSLLESSCISRQQKMQGKFKIAALLVFLFYLHQKIFTTVYNIPELKNDYWGPTLEQNELEDTTIKPFKMDISEDVLQDLNARLLMELNSSRLAPPLEGMGFQYGLNTKFLTTVVAPYWLNIYNWREREKIYNQWPHFITRIGGLNIHYYHIKPQDNTSGKETRALLLLHGYPGSFVEMWKLIPLLTEKNGSKYQYELVLASLPGYGFSSAASKPGLGSAAMANIFVRLMDRLNFKKFFVAGRDAGAVTAADMAALYSNRIYGVHSGLCWESSAESYIRRIIAHSFPSIFLTPEERSAFDKLFSGWTGLMKDFMRETGYLSIQSSKPDTIGIGLTQSPLGLAAYILEKFSGYSNRKWISKEDGGLTDYYAMDELIDNLMVYWVTGSITSAIRFYKESFGQNCKINLNRIPVHVPYACQLTGGDIAMGLFPKFVAKARYRNLQRYSIHPTGGHFAALESPDIVSEDIVAFFNTL